MHPPHHHAHPLFCTKPFFTSLPNPLFFPSRVIAQYCFLWCLIMLLSTPVFFLPPPTPLSSRAMPTQDLEAVLPPLLTSYQYNYICTETLCIHHHLSRICHLPFILSEFLTPVRLSVSRILYLLIILLPLGFKLCSLRFYLCLV